MCYIDSVQVQGFISTYIDTYYFSINDFKIDICTYLKTDFKRTKFLNICTYVHSSVIVRFPATSSVCLINNQLKISPEFHVDVVD